MSAMEVKSFDCLLLDDSDYAGFLCFPSLKMYLSVHLQMTAHPCLQLCIMMPSHS